MTKINLLIVIALLCSSLSLLAQTPNTPQLPQSENNIKKNDVKELEKIVVLEDLIIQKERKIKTLEDELASKNDGGINFATWAGIMLSAIAIILTILGVIIAIFSFFGYKKIMSSAQEIAIKKASSVATEIANTMVPEATKKELIALFDDKKFDGIVQEYVEKALYRGISPDKHDELIELDEGKE